MKLLLIFVCLLAFADTAKGQRDYLPTNSHARLSISSVSLPTNKTKPLEITFVFQCDGKTPIALSQEQFAVDISTDKQPWLFYSKAIFPPGSPNIYTLAPNEKITLKIYALKNRFSSKQSWSKLQPGKYTLTVRLGSGKTHKFDYQWLGTWSSNDYTLQIK